MTRQQRLQTLIQNEFAPTKLDVINESHSHSVPANSETHFKVICVSEKFAGLSRVQRQRALYDLAAAELRSGLHAFSLQLFTPEEWAEYASKLNLDSPDCHVGSKRS